MPTIDTENAKQIRQPMQVEISVALADPGNPLTYSGYAATAKVADGVLGQRSWPMRQLADLQGDGFPLDGSRELYETKTASQANGKLGVRGHVGQDADVTISRSRTIPSVEVRASGASAVVYGGTAYSLETGSANVLIGATSATLTFVPKDATVRAEVEYIGSTTEFVIRNDTLIRAVVSLRSDLSIENPTLPESELNIEAFVSTDVSEYVAGIETNTPILYRTGYDGDMSEYRRFYVADQVTWANNILSIHAVDAVGRLDEDAIPIELCVDHEQKTAPSLNHILGLVVFYLDHARIEYVKDYTLSLYNSPKFSTQAQTAAVERGVSARAVIAEIMNLFHFEGINTARYGGRAEFWPVYVDAGIPTLTLDKPAAKWEIWEHDCGSVSKTNERINARITAELATVYSTSAIGTDALVYAGNSKVGSAQWYKDQAAYVSLDKPVTSYVIGTQQKNIDPTWGQAKTLPVIPAAVWNDGTGLGFVFPRYESTNMDPDVISPFKLGRRLLDNEVTEDEFDDAYYVLTQIVPWDLPYNLEGANRWEWTTPSAAWAGLTAAGVIDEGEPVADLDVMGFGPAINAYKKTYVGQGSGADVTISPAIKGAIHLGSASSGASGYTMKIYPDNAIRNLFKRSNITGSFTWKGDPRMQPRDVVTFHRLDGTDEVITLENITITHEGGGTSAEITYRKGIV